jgi:undecaprenyl-diphosphatase
VPADHSFDERLLHWIDQHRVAPLTSFTRALMHAGTAWQVLLAVGIAGVIWVVAARAWRPGAAAVIAAFLGGEGSRLLKDHFQRARPPAAESLVRLHGYAMPSSHSAVTSAMVVALLIAVPWRSERQRLVVGAVLVSALVVVAASMVYLGAHWATDVLAGWALGIVAGAVVGALLRPRTGRSTR